MSCVVMYQLIQKSITFICAIKEFLNQISMTDLLIFCVNIINDVISMNEIRVMNHCMKLRNIEMFLLCICIKKLKMSKNFL